MNIPKVTLPLLAAVALSVVSAEAAVITFTLNGVEGEQDDGKTFTMTEGGVTLTLSNPYRVSAGDFHDVLPFADTPHVGLTFNTGWYLTAFDFAFDTDVTITNIAITVVNNNTVGSTFTLSAPGSTSTSAISFSSENLIIPGGGFFLLSGDVGTWTASYGPGLEGAHASIYGFVNSFTVETIPEPSTYTFLGSVGIFGIGAYMRKRRQARLAAQ
jgi:hypothetical protein